MKLLEKKVGMNINSKGEKETYTYLVPSKAVNKIMLVVVIAVFILVLVAL